MLKEAVRTAEVDSKATVFGYWVNDPQRYGVAEFDEDGNCLSIEEKPTEPKSNPLFKRLETSSQVWMQICLSVKSGEKHDMKAVLLDTSFIIRLLSEDQELHDNAVSYFKLKIDFESLR